MLFPILKVHSLPKLRDFLDCVFPLALCFISHGFKYAPWQFRRIVQILRSTCFKILRTQNSRVILFLGLCFKLGSSNIFGWNDIIYIPFFCFDFFVFCLGSETFSELHFCFALLEFLPCWEALQALAVFTRRLISWRFLVCVNPVISQLQRCFSWFFPSSL